MGIFSKNYKPIHEYGEAWTVKQTRIQGKPTLIRYNRALSKATGHPEYPFQIGVAIPLVNPNESGMPDKSEVSQLDKIEDLLIDMFGTEAILVMVITNGIMREFVLYAKEWKPEIYDAQLKKLSKKTRPHSIQFIMKKDVKWFTFKSLS